MLGWHYSAVVSKLVEGTMNTKWGSGLGPDQTKECLPDYWPGENQMGKILINLWKYFQNEAECMNWKEEVSKEEWKCKGTSPLSNTAKKQFLT